MSYTAMKRQETRAQSEYLRGFNDGCESGRDDGGVTVVGLCVVAVCSAIMGSVGTLVVQFLF